MAHDNLDEIAGNFVLCSYIAANKNSSGIVITNLFKQYNTTNNLIKFITENLPLLSSLGFAISYKVEDMKYFCDFSENKIKGINLSDIEELMQLQYKKIIELQDFDKKHLNIFPEYSLPKIKKFTDIELKHALKLIFNLDIINLSSKQIIEISEKEGFSIYIPILQAIVQQNVATLKILLDFQKEINNNFIMQSIKSFNIEIINMVVSRATSIDLTALESAIKTGKTEIANIIINKINEIADNSHLELAIETGNTKIIDMVLEKMGNINSSGLKLLIKLDNYKAIEKITKFDSTHLKVALATGNIELTKIIFSKMTKIEDYDLRLTKQISNHELINIVESYKNNLNSKIESDKHTSIIDNHIEVDITGENISYV